MLENMKLRLRHVRGHIQVCTAGWWIRAKSSPTPSPNLNTVFFPPMLRSDFPGDFRPRTFLEDGFCGVETENFELDDTREAMSQREGSACISPALLLSDTAHPCPLPPPLPPSQTASPQHFPSQ